MRRPVDYTFRPVKSGTAAGGYITLITVIIVGAIVATVAVFLLLTGVGSSKSSRGVESNASAKAAAAGCANLALAAIQANTSLTTPASGNQTLDPTSEETCNYQISGTSPNYTIVSTGTVDANGGNYVRRLTITLNQVAPQLIIASWQETP